MAEPIREQILAALATQLGAVRNPEALDYADARLIALYDEAETVTQEWGHVHHQMSVRLTAIERYDETMTPKGTAANRLLAWLQSAALSDLSLGGLCENITAQQAAPAYSDDPSAYVGAIIEVRVDYRTAPNDLSALPP